MAIERNVNPTVPATRPVSGRCLQAAIPASVALVVAAALQVLVLVPELVVVAWGADGKSFIQ